MEDPKVTDTTTQPSPNVRYVTPTELRQIKTQQRHDQMVAKKRQIRWQSPAANAKIEDIVLVAKDLQVLIENLNSIFYEIQVTQKALFAKGIIGERDIKAVKDRDQERMAKFNELKDNTTMSNVEKAQIAKEYDIPLDSLGITNEGDGIGTISEPA
jgi:hypothetical protein